MKGLKRSSLLILFGIFLLAAALRLYNVDWDQGAHMHPDERAIVMAVEKLQLPQSISQFLSPESPWNPEFFAYGSFPFYLLKFAGWSMSPVDPLFAHYTLINIIGRYISAFSDLITIILLFRIGRKLFSTEVGLLASFFYTISVLPIQLSHFYAVDTILTTAIIAALYQLILLYEKPAWKHVIFAGIFFGIAIASKVSAVLLIVSIIFYLLADIFFRVIKHPRKPKTWLPQKKLLLKQSIQTAAILVVAAITFIICMPYAVIDFNNFWTQTEAQSVMTHNAFIFPYTLQYVGIIPYLYELRNMFYYGFGPLLAMIIFAGTIYVLFMKRKNEEKAKDLILFSFLIIYFLIVGKFAVGFMRYMLPVYPLLCLFGAVLAYKLITGFAKQIRNTILLNTLYLILYTILLLWPVSFFQIYTRNNTRTDASYWINKNIPNGKSLAIEHWDDALPLYGQDKYQMITLPLYDPDTTEKWRKISQQLKQSDYIILASNRLYTPLQKLTDCQNLPPGKCYPITAQYYNNLFSGGNVLTNVPGNAPLRFKKVAEFTSYPTIPFVNIAINDQKADESFTVYDHPKIIIFQRQ